MSEEKYKITNHQQLFNAVRASDYLETFNVFSTLLNAYLQYHGQKNPKGALESVYFGVGVDDKSLSPKEMVSDVLQGNLGRDLLHVAARYGNDVVVRYLVKLGVSVDVLDETYNTPLMTALQGWANERTVQTLLNLRANIYDETPRGTSVLQMCVSYSLLEWKNMRLILEQVKRDHFNKIEFIVEKLLNLDCLFCHATLLKDLEILIMMLTCGCSLSDADPETGRTALHVAVLLKDLNTITFLLNYGADINIVDHRGLSPFALAHDYGDSAEESEILNYLLDRGSSLDLRRFDLYDQQMFILSSGRNQIVHTLLTRNIVKFHVRDLYGKTSLHHIAKNRLLINEQDVIDDLQQLRFDINILDYEWHTPLYLASAAKNLGMGLFLLKNGANVNRQNIWNISPLHAATVCLWSNSDRRDICDLVEMLLLYGADPQSIIKDNFEATGHILRNLPQNLTIIDNILKEQSYDLAKPVLAYIVLHIAKGGQINQVIRRKINSDEKLQEQFESLQEELEHLKLIKLTEWLSAHYLMIEDEKKLVMFTRSKTVFSVLKNFYMHVNLDMYFIYLLKQRLEKIFVEIVTRQSVSDMLCEYFETTYSACPGIIDNIIDYLTSQDLQSVFHKVYAA